MQAYSGSLALPHEYSVLSKVCKIMMLVNYTVYPFLYAEMASRLQKFQGNNHVSHGRTGVLPKKEVSDSICFKCSGVI